MNSVRVCCWLWLFVLAALPTLCPAADLVGPSADDLIIVSVSVNSVPMGEAFVAVSSSGGFWLTTQDFKRLGVTLKGETVSVDGRDYILIAPSQQVKIVLAIESLALRFDVAPELLGLQRESLASSPRLSLQEAHGVQGFVNYSVGSQYSTGRAAAAVLDLVVNASWRHWILRSEHSYAANARADAELRVQSFLQYDDDARMLRWTLGDTSAATGAFSRISPVAGLSVSRLFELAPGYQANPTFALSGVARTPQSAEIFVDGVRIRTIDIKPGRYELYDLNYFAGLRNVDVVLRDRNGVEQRMTVPHFFSNANLAKGVHQFRYSAGLVRDAESPDKYSGMAWTGLHRYGVTDQLTIGSAAERAAGFERAGLGGTLSTRMGVASADGSLSRATGTTAKGHALLASYGYSVQSFSVGISQLWQSPNFGQSRADVEATALAREPRDPLTRQLQASVGWAFSGRRSVSTNFVRTQSNNGQINRVNTLRFTHGFGRGFAMSMGAAVVRNNNQNSRSFNIGFTFPLGSRVSANLSHEQLPDKNRVSSVRIAESVPSGEGIGYRLAHDQGAKMANTDAYAQWNHPFGNLNASARQLTAADATTANFAEVRASGALVWAHSQLFISPPVQQSYAVVDTDGISGVRIYQNGQLAGKTRGNGFLLLPALSANVSNQIQIDDRDIPLDRDIRRLTDRIVPRALIGAHSKFGAKKVVSVAGRLSMAKGDQRVPLISAEITVVGQKAIRSTTSPEGDFYIEDLAPGTYVINAENRATQCRATLVIADLAKTIQEVGELNCEIIRN